MHMIKVSTRIGKVFLASIAGILFSIPAAQATNYDSGIFEFQQRLANNGNPQAQYKLANMYESGRGAAKDINKAREWYQKSAANKYKPAKHRLTYLDVKRSGFKPPHKVWLKDLSTDAKKGDVEALYLLGEMSEYGIGVKKNLAQARAYYKSASTKGNVDAENRLYEVEDKLNQSKADKLAKQEAKLAKQEAQQKKQEAQRKAAQKKSAQNSKQKQAQLKAIQERNRLEMERRRLAEQRRKLEAQQRALAKKEAEAKAKAKAEAREAPKEEKKSTGFESDLCSGRAARFRTQCK